MKNVRAFFDGDDYIVYFKSPSKELIERIRIEFDPTDCPDAYVKPLERTELKFPDGNGPATGLTPTEFLERFGNAAYKWLAKRRLDNDEMHYDIDKAMLIYLKSKYSYITDATEETSKWSETTCNQFLSVCDVCFTEEIKKNISQGYIDYEAFITNATLETKRLVIAVALDNLLKYILPPPMRKSIEAGTSRSTAPMR